MGIEKYWRSYTFLLCSQMKNEREITVISKVSIGNKIGSLTIL